MLGSNFALSATKSYFRVSLSFLESPSLLGAFVHSMDSVPAPDLSSGSQDPRLGGGGAVHTPHCVGFGPPPARGQTGWAPAKFSENISRAPLWIGSNSQLDSDGLAREAGGGRSEGERGREG